MREWISGAARVISENVVLDYLWGLCLSVSVAILFLLLIRPVMKRLPRIGMYLLWIFVVFRIVVPFSVTGIYELLPKEVGQTVAYTRQSVAPAQIRVRLNTEARKSYGGKENSYRLNQKTTQKNVQVPEAEEKETDRNTGKTISMDVILLAVWFAGVLFCVLYLICSLIANQRLFRHAGHLFDNVYEHPYACSSFVGGIISPRIYVPKGMGADDLECILAHERIHIRRWDYRVKPVAFLVFSILWFNPLVWAAYRMMMKDMEISCDEAVIRRLGSDARKRYSYLLLAMASGDNGILCPNTAFGAGVVNERIHHIMEYKKPSKFLTAVVVIAVMLCGCGISSAPKDTVSKLPADKQKSSAVYVEQTMPDVNLKWQENETAEDELVAAIYGSGIDAKGELSEIGWLEAPENNQIVAAVKPVFRDGEWQKEEAKWGDNLKKLLKGKKNMECGYLFYGADGKLYLPYHQYSMSTDTYVQNPEKYEDEWYLVDQFLYRVDEETGEVTELDIPKAKAAEAYEQDAGVPEKSMAYNIYAVLPNGDYVVCNMGNIFSVYSGVTGEKTADLPFGNNRSKMTNIYAGNDFVCWTENNENTNMYEVYVCDADGQGSYVLETGIEYVYDENENIISTIAMGVSEDTIIVATGKGISEAEYGDDEFHSVMDTDKNNVYCLGSDGCMPVGNVYKDAKGVYYLELMDADNNSIRCYYAQQEQN